MTDEEFSAMIKDIDKRSLPVTVDLYTWISVLGMVQLALRHPGVQGSHVASRARQFGEALEAALAELIPEAAETMARGWNPIFDEPVN